MGDSLLDVSSIQHRPFHGITHVFRDVNSGDVRFYGIILSELRHANSRSSAQRLWARASSSVRTSRTVLCAPAPTPTLGRKPTSEIMGRKPGTEGRFPDFSTNRDW